MSLAAPLPRRALTDDAWWVVVSFCVATAVRLVFVARMGLPPFDPWRHLALVRNLREGLGFTLFDGQPYLWYGPTWYYLCAALPAWFRMEWLATILSALCAPVTYLLTRRLAPGAGRFAPVAAAMLVAAAGPLVAFTCHQGPEALALLLTLLALLLLATTSNATVSFISGLVFGTALVLRLNFAFDGLLFLPWMRSRARTAALAAGTALPLLAAWWRNHTIIRAFPWVFTWDGLATRSADFDLVSTLAIQLHPAVQEALRRLHEQVIPWPEWIYGPRGIAWGPIGFFFAGLLGVAFSRRWSLALAAGTALAYFLLADSTLSSHFFRIYLVVFPVLFMGTAIAADRLWTAGRPRWLAVGWIAFVLVAGAGYLLPWTTIPLDAVTPPNGLLDAGRYMVNSGFYQPESLVYRYPDKRFIGLPLDPDQLEPFLEAYPDYRHVLWQEFSIQDGVLKRLSSNPRVRRTATGLNPAARKYDVYVLAERAIPFSE